MEQGLAQTSLDIRGIFLMLRRHVRLLALGAALGVVLALVLLAVNRPQYTATTALMVDSREEKILNDAIVAPFRPSSNAIASEAAVIVAPNVLKRVVDKLELSADPDFAAHPHTPGLFGTVKAQLFMLFGVRPREANSGEGLSDETIEIIEALRQSIEVVPSQYTNLLQVNVTSKDPRKAARIANAVADAYLVQQLEGRYDATRRATDWLKERLDEHKVKLRRSEERFERLKAEMDLVEKEGATLEERQLVRLNDELVQQSARTADARAKYESVLSQADGHIFNEKQLSEIAQSTLITHLRTQLAQVTRDEDSLNSRFGNWHPAVVKVRAEKQGLSREIDGEIRRIVAVLKNEFEIATNREASLRESLKAGALRASSQRPEYVRLRELQREAESDKALYEAMLQRMKQAAAQETWKTADFRVVAEAVPPLTSSKPKTKVLVLAGLGLGFGLGIGLTLLTELLDKTFKRNRDVEAKLAVPHLVDVPLLPARQLSAGGPTRTPGQNAFHFATQHIGSPFADAMLGLLSSLQSTSRDAPIKTVMFTSATPGEGKSVVAANFAQTAARSGFKVLLICTDLRTPTVNWFGPTNMPKADLVDYLSGKAEIEATIARSEQALIDLIPAGRSAANAASLLASPRMDKLLEWAKANYDLVVIDTVAIVTCLDGRMLARRIDATVIVIEWLKTRVDLAKEAVDLLLKNDARIVGAVLNKVDFTKARLYGLNTFA
jgi:capsular exopolysaccharide synthesis family protein